MSAVTAARIGRRLGRLGRTLATAESCTGGLLGGRVTAVPGSSAWFVGGVIAYANAVKCRLLGVESRRLARFGAVSAETASAMADGVRRRLGADYGIGITGIAGPGGAVPGKPVGTVWLAVAGPDGVVARRFRFAGGRTAVRQAACRKALEMLDERLPPVA